MMKVQNSSGNFRIEGPHLNGQTAGRTPPTDPTVSTCSLARAIEEMGAAMVFPRDAEIYRENSPASYLYKVVSGTVRGGVGGVVGIEGGVVSGVINLESSGVSASDWRPRHEEHYQ